MSLMWGLVSNFLIHLSKWQSWTCWIFSKGEHWTICAWGAPYCLSALSPLIPLIPYLQLGAALSSYLWQLASTSLIYQSLMTPLLLLGVRKSFSAITDQIQGMGDESIWIHQTAVNENVKSDDGENKSMTFSAKRALQYVMSPGSFHWTRWLTKSRHLNLCQAA